MKFKTILPILPLVLLFRSPLPAQDSSSSISCTACKSIRFQKNSAIIELVHTGISGRADLQLTKSAWPKKVTIRFLDFPALERLVVVADSNYQHQYQFSSLDLSVSQIKQWQQSKKLDVMLPEWLVRNAQHTLTISYIVVFVR